MIALEVRVVDVRGGGRGTSSGDRVSRSPNGQDKNKLALATNDNVDNVPEEDSGVDKDGKLREADIMFDDEQWEEAEAYNAEKEAEQSFLIDNYMRTTLKDYTYHGDQDINGFLRHGADPKKLYQSPEAVEAAVRSIDSAMDRSFTTESMMLYRGAGPEMSQGLSKGDIITDKGFMSTSLKWETAKGFADYNANHEGSYNSTIFHIYAPKGTRAVHMGPNTSRSYTEAEVLVHRNPRMRVDSIQKDSDGVKNVYVTLLKK